MPLDENLFSPNLSLFLAEMFWLTEKPCMQIDWWSKAPHSQSCSSFWFICTQRFLWMQVSVIHDSQQLHCRFPSMFAWSSHAILLWSLMSFQSIYSIKLINLQNIDYHPCHLLCLGTWDFLCRRGFTILLM